MEDLRKLLECVPKLSWLDVGNRGTSGPILNKATNAYNAVSVLCQGTSRDLKILTWQLERVGDIAHARPRDKYLLWCETLPTGTDYSREREGHYPRRIRSQQSQEE